MKLYVIQKMEISFQGKVYVYNLIETIEFVDILHTKKVGKEVLEIRVIIRLFHYQTHDNWKPEQRISNKVENETNHINYDILGT